MSARRTPPFRADHVGSLLRPRELLAARAVQGRGEIGDAALRAVEDDCIRGAVRMQEEIMSLAGLGLRYLQLDDTNFAVLCDDRIREATRALGEDPDELPHTYCKLLNEMLTVDDQMAKLRCVVEVAEEVWG